MVKRIVCALLLLLLLGCSNTSPKGPVEEAPPTQSEPVTVEPVVSPAPSEDFVMSPAPSEALQGGEDDILPPEAADLKVSLEEAFQIVHEVTTTNSYLEVENNPVPMEIYKINRITESQVAIVTMYYDGMDSTNKYYYFTLGNLLIDGEWRHLDLFNEYAVNGDTGEMIKKYEKNGLPFGEMNPEWPL